LAASQPDPNRKATVITTRRRLQQGSMSGSLRRSGNLRYHNCFLLFFPNCGLGCFSSALAIPKQEPPWSQHRSPYSIMPSTGARYLVSQEFSATAPRQIRFFGSIRLVSFPDSGRKRFPSGHHAIMMPSEGVGCAVAANRHGPVKSPYLPAVASLSLAGSQTFVLALLLTYRGACKMQLG
jgi:hypothetical protein